MNKLLGAIGILVTRDIKRRIREGKIVPPSKSRKEGTTLVKSSKLVNSIHWVATSDQVIIGTDLKYARIHHEGGIIRPVSAQYLAIPLTKEAAAKRPRDWKNTFVRKSVIFRKLDSGEIEALYALKTQVVMPARPYMEVPDQTWGDIRHLVQKYIANNIKRGN
ncbi:MAG: phage virion morphogenesis protein [Candidatus Cloacimonetes bacterium]|nr:phage virion morphogenesis protein [Candidatus Cloacimonadota bacterium]